MENVFVDFWQVVKPFLLGYLTIYALFFVLVITLIVYGFSKVFKSEDKQKRKTYNGRNYGRSYYDRDPFEDDPFDDDH